MMCAYSFYPRRLIPTSSNPPRRLFRVTGVWNDTFTYTRNPKHIQQKHPNPPPRVQLTHFHWNLLGIPVVPSQKVDLAGTYIVSNTSPTSYVDPSRDLTPASQSLGVVGVIVFRVARGLIEFGGPASEGPGEEELGEASSVSSHCFRPSECQIRCRSRNPGAIRHESNESARCHAGVMQVSYPSQTLLDTRVVYSPPMKSN